MEDITIINNGIDLDESDNKHVSDFKELLNEADRMGYHHFNDFVFGLINGDNDTLCNKLIKCSPVQITIMKEYMSSIKREYKLREREKNEENVDNDTSNDMHDTRNENNEKQCGNNNNK